MSGTMTAVLAGAATIQLALLTAALWRWSRTPEDRLTLGRWPWLAIILLLSMVGPIAFLAAGRGPGPLSEAPRAERARGAVEDAVADVYGPGAG